MVARIQPLEQKLTDSQAAATSTPSALTGFSKFLLTIGYPPAALVDNF